MTLTSTPRRAGPFTGNGVTTSFPFTFKVFDVSHIRVTRNVLGVEQTLGLNTDYSVTLNPDQEAAPGGAITYPISGSPLPGGQSLTLTGAVPYDQPTDLPSGGNYRAETVENALDYLEMQIQQLAQSAGGEIITTDLEQRLASISSAGNGAGMVGFQDALDYGPNTVGAAIKAMSGGGSRYVFEGSGEAGDDTAALAAYYATLPLGAVLEIHGLARVTSTLTLNRRISIVTPGNNDAIIVAVGVGNDGVVFDQGTALDELGTGTAGGINGILVNLHVYGLANACRNTVVLRRVDRSRIYLNVRAGAAQYGVVVEGCLINRIHIESTVNYAPPITNPGAPLDHLLLKKNVAFSVATNINQFWLNLEGCRKGLVLEAMPGEGGNVINGVIEGLTGKCFEVADCSGLHIADFWAEANEGDSTFTNCQNLRVGPGVNCYDGMGRADDWIFTNTRGLVIDGYYGGYNIQSTCVGTQLGQVGTPSPTRSICADVSAVQTGWLYDSNNSTFQKGGEGQPTMDSIYHNPFFDLWSVNGRAAGPPVGVSIYGSGTAVFSSAVTFPGNPTASSVMVTTGGTTLDNGIRIEPLNQPWRSDEFVSFMIPVYAQSATNGRVRVLATADGGSSFFELGTTTVANAWTVIRGSIKLQVGQNWSIALATWNGTSYTNGWQFYVGGCTIVRGPVAPKHLTDSYGRRAYVAPNVTHAPDRFGMFAYTGAGKLHFASATNVPGDWIILN
jgi:hypothetical protein